MRRGEIWTAAGGSGHTGKPRPVVVVQDDRFDATDSVTVCAFTSDHIDSPLMRLTVEPDASTGLASGSQLMVDKIVTVPRARLGQRIGVLSGEDVLRLNRAIVVFLGLAG